MRQIRGRKGRGRGRGGARGRDYSYIVAAQDADDLAAAVQLDKQSLIEVLECSCSWLAVVPSRVRQTQT